MWITHSYLGVTRGRMRYLFFVLYEDYIEAQSRFSCALDQELERFARNLGNNAAVVKPFLGDVEKTRSQILEKPWDDRQRKELYKTPSLLMINTDFDTFDPREHPYFLLHCGARMREIEIGMVYKFHTVLQRIAEAANNTEVDLFDAARKIYFEISPSDAVRIIEAKSGIFWI